MIDFSNASILIISPHPDDEVLGCGGLIHRCKREGGKVHILYLTNGDTFDYSNEGYSTELQRRSELIEVARFLRVDGFKIAFPGNRFHLRLDALPLKSLIDEIERGDDVSLLALKPNVLIFPSGDDYNQDHRAAHLAAIAALRPAPSNFKPFQPIALTYEIPSSNWKAGATLGEGKVHVALDKEDLLAKCHAMRLYRSQLKTRNGPTSIYAIKLLARLRGLASSNNFAENYGLLRAVL